MNEYYGFQRVMVIYVVYSIFALKQQNHLFINPAAFHADTLAFSINGLHTATNKMI